MVPGTLQPLSFNADQVLKQLSNYLILASLKPRLSALTNACTHDGQDPLCTGLLCWSPVHNMNHTSVCYSHALRGEKKGHSATIHLETV